jgi:transposase
VNSARGLTKSYGERLRKCSTQKIRETAKGLSQELRDALDPLFGEIESLNERIAEYDRRIEQIAKEIYPQVALLKQVKGVRTLIALTYVLTLDDPRRFRRSRDAGCFAGLRPGRRNSGMSQPQLHISKEGDVYLRTMLVQGAHCILGPFGEDSDLRRWGLKLAERGGKNAKKRAVVAVARSWQSCFTSCGSAERFMNHFGTTARQAPAATRTPNWHRATIAHKRVRMEGWRQRRLGSEPKTT